MYAGFPQKTPETIRGQTKYGYNIMTLSDGVQLYGVALTTLTVVVGAIRYLISSRICPLEDKIKKLSEDTEAVKEALVSDIKEISQGNFNFRLKYEGAIKDLRLLMSEKYVTKAEIDKYLDELKRKFEKNSERIENIRRDNKR
jgi:hypothetical protein